MATTAREQYLLELINDARLDPVGDMDRYLGAAASRDIKAALDFFHVDLNAYAAAVRALAPARPLAYNEKLGAAALGHDQVLVATDSQTHQAPGEADLLGRLTAQGYSLRAAGENVYSYALDPLYAHAGFMVDWGYGTGGMQDGAGHRANIMNDAFREIGVAGVAETDPATGVGPFVVTEDFGAPVGQSPIVLGVAYQDQDHDRFYSVGEGRAGLSVSFGGASTVSGGSGGYALAANATGRQVVTLSGAGLTGAVTFETTLSPGQNVKLDVVDGATLLTSTSGKVSGAVSSIQGLGILGLQITTDDASRTIAGTKGSDTIHAGAGDDTFVAGLGHDLFDGGAGSDTAVFDFAWRDATFSVAGSTIRVAGHGADVALTGVEQLRFTDKVLATGQILATGHVPDASAGPDHVNAMFRFYDTKTGDHFYTGSADEKAHIIKTLPNYVYEGVGWAAPDKSAATTDVFRFYDTKTSTHFFTTDPGERDWIVKTLATFQYEGVAFQAYKDAPGDGHVTLERFYNTSTGLHHYSADASETAGIKAGLVGASWVDEGPGFVVHVPTPDMLLA